MPYIRLSTRSPRYTYIRTSPVKGMSWRAYKTCKAWVKRHHASPAARKSWLNNPDMMLLLAKIIAPNKHNWIA